jgi:hypothetical protein
MKPYPKFKGDWQLKIHLKRLKDTFIMLELLAFSKILENVPVKSFSYPE